MSLRLLVVLLVFGAAAATAGEEAVVTCRAMTTGGSPAPASVHLRKRGAETPTSMDCVAASCVFPDVPPGPYEVVVEAPGTGAPLRQDLDVGPGERILLETRLALEGGGASTLRVRERYRRDLATTFGERRLQDLPASRDPWSLLETAETNVIADRIDGGGLYLSEAGRLSTHGASWSQTSFALGDLDITDPEGTGAPLLRPDLEAFEILDVATTNSSPVAGDPGTRVTLFPRDPPARWQTTLRLDSLLGTSGAESTPPPVARLASWKGASVSTGGPLGKRWGIQTTGSFLESSRTEAGREDSRSNLSSLLTQLIGRLSSRDELRALAAFQAANVPFPGRARFGDRGLEERDSFGHLQASWRHRTRGAGTWNLGAAYSRGQFAPDSATEPGTVERFRDGPVPELSLPARSVRQRFDAQATAHLPELESGLGTHNLVVGLALGRVLSTSRPERPTPATAELVGGLPARVWEYGFPGPESRRHATELSAHVGDRIRLGELLNLEVGARVGRSSGSADGVEGGIRWFSVDPHVSARLKLAGSLALFGSYGRYTHRLPLRLLFFGDPTGPQGSVYAWDDASGDGRFQESERGRLIARVGPGAPVSSLAADLRAPRTGEWVLGIEGRYRDFLSARLAGIARRETRLVESVNVGVPASAYATLFVPDTGGNILSPADDQLLPLYDRLPESFGRDAYVLTNPAGHTTHFEGLELTLEAKLRRLDFLLGGTAHRSVGSGSNRGFRPQENDQGVPGELFDDPNAATFSRGRLFSDRAYTLKFSSSLRVEPDLRLGLVARYQDGQPFARFVIAFGLAQGSEAIQAIPRGRSRFSYTLTLDARAEKGIRLPKARLAATLEVFNLLDKRNEVEEDVTTGPAFRTPSLSQPGRTWRGGLRVSF